MNNSTDKANLARMSPAAQARAMGYRPDTAGRLGLIPMAEAARYAAGGEPEKKPEKSEEQRQAEYIRRKPLQKTPPRVPGGWTEEEDNTLYHLLTKGASQAVIANALDRTTSMVSHRVRALGWTGMGRGRGGAPEVRVSGYHWRPEEDAALRDLRYRQGLSWHDVAARIGRSVSACQARAQIVGEAVE